MRILFDLIASQPTRTSKYHGGSEYCKSIFYKMVENIFNNIEVVIDPTRGIDEELIKVCKENKIVINECKNINQLSDLINSGFDKFYSALPYEYNNLKMNSDVEFIYTIHGLRQLEMPTDKYEGRFEKKGIKFFIRKFIRKVNPSILDNRRKRIFNELFNVTTNRKILVPSYHTKYSLINFFPEIDVKEVEVLYAPEKTIRFVDFSKENYVLEKYKLEKQKYILMVSGDRWLKNNYRGVKALDELFSENREELKQMKVVVLGVADPKVYVNKIRNVGNFIFEGYKEQDELEILYKNAHLFLYPTLNEGFGYPPLEALKYETNVAVSAISSITEVCGDAVLYFNPFDLNEIKIRVLQSFDNEIMKKKEKLNQYKKISKYQQESLENIIKMILD